MRWIAVVLLLAVTMPAVAATRTVAVSYFDNTSKDASLEPLRKGLADMLITDLSAIGSLRVVEREKLEALLGEIALGKGGFLDPKTAQQLGKGLGAEYVLTGAYLLQGDQLRVDVRVVRTETAEIVATEKASGAKAEFFDIEKELVDAFVATLELKLDRAEKRAVGKRQTGSFDAVAAYSRGLDARDRGDEAAAAAAFRAALEADPDYAAAKDAMGRLAAIAKREAKATSEEVAQVEAKRGDPDFGPWLQQLFMRIGYAPDGEKAKQRLRILTWLVENDIRAPGAGGSDVLAGQLWISLANWNVDPDFVERLPNVIEFLMLRHPGDPSVQQLGLQVTMLEGQLERLRTRRAEVRKGAEEAGDVLESSVTVEGTGCAAVRSRQSAFGSSLRLLVETTNDAARIERWAKAFLEKTARDATTACDARERGNMEPGIDGGRLAVATHFAVLGDETRSRQWWGSMVKPAVYASSEETLRSALRFSRPRFEARNEARALVDAVEAALAKLRR